jgi:hypothetical protein
VRAWGDAYSVLGGSADIRRLRKGGLKRSVATDAGIPPGIIAACTNRHDSPLMAPTLGAAVSQLGGIVPGQHTCHLDAGYYSQPARRALAE